MSPAEIERLITKAVNQRPTVTKAPLNLYIYRNKLICGARVVMPKEAVFVAIVPKDRIENGFSKDEWKHIVDKTLRLLAGSQVVRSERPNHETAEIELKPQEGKGVSERRRERRLRWRRPVWFAEGIKEKFCEAELIDVASGGLAFLCSSSEIGANLRQQITTRFSVPYFGENDFVKMEKFTRIGHICRIDNSSGVLRRVAVQFAQHLPFKPGEQGLGLKIEELRVKS